VVINPLSDVYCQKTDHILGHKANFNKYKKIEIILCILTDQNGIKLEINGKENHKIIQTHGDGTAHLE
jgi:hypothetical protein